MIKRGLFLGLLLCLFIQIGFAQQVLKEPISGLEYIIKKGDKSGDLIIMIHGYGSNERDLMSLSRHFPIGSTIICPRGNRTYGPGKYSWYDITFRNDGNHQRNKAQADISEKAIASFTKAMTSEYSNGTGKIVVGGFSQGGILSVSTVLLHPELIDGIIAFSGTLLSEELKADPAKSELYSKVKVFYGHGTLDKVLPIKHGRICRDRLSSAGVQLTYKEYTMDHTISNQEVQDVILWYKGL